MLKQPRCRSNTNQLLVASTLLYLAIPVALFLLGWLRAPWALLATALLLFGIWQSVKNCNTTERSALFEPKFLLLAFTIALFYDCYFNGLRFHYLNANI